MTGTSGLRTERITLDLQTYYYVMNCPMKIFYVQTNLARCPTKNDIGQTFDLANENCYFQLCNLVKGSSTRQKLPQGCTQTLLREGGGSRGYVIGVGVHLYVNVCNTPPPPPPPPKFE